MIGAHNENLNNNKASIVHEDIMKEYQNVLQKRKVLILSIVLKNWSIFGRT